MSKKFIVLAVVVAILIIAGGIYFWPTFFDEKATQPVDQTQEEGETATEKPILAGIGKATGYVKSVYEINGVRFLDIDYIQWLSGDDAVKAMEEDGKCPADIYPDSSYCIPNGFYIRNQNPKIRTFEILNNAEILRASAFDYSPDGIKSISYEELKSLFTPDSYFKDIPFNIEISDGVIIKILEQYIP